MGVLIKSFTVGRNFLKRTTAESAEAAHAAVSFASQGSVDLQSLKSSDNGRYNVIRDLMSFTGILRREGSAAIVTEVGQRYLALYTQSSEDAWRWLVTRSLWLYVMPNGTDTECNRKAQALGVSFSFFRMLLGLLSAMTGLSNDARYLSYEELCHLLDDDANWTKGPAELLQTVLDNRNNGTASASSTRLLLGDLEDQFGVGRDNLSTVLNKAFFQTGLFEYRPTADSTRGACGIALKSNADPVLQRRIRFVLDNLQTFPTGTDWNEFLQPKAVDLPLEVSDGGSPKRAQTAIASPDLSSFEAHALAVLKERKNVILFGPPGTGKSHAAFSIADFWSTDNGGGSVINVTFHPAFGYEDFVQGFRPEENNPGQYTLQAGPLLIAVGRAIELAESGKSVLVMIDEINRGDVARIFGELITYIEPDKRGRRCRLALSPGVEFYVPENLYFLGTMNSADKSVSLLDVALRRRFAFLEVMPDPSAYERLEKWVPSIRGLSMSAVLEELNKRLLQSGVEPDRCIGHALLGVGTDSIAPEAALASRFEYDVIPLVQEYCYLDRPRMKRILGPLVDDGGRRSWQTDEEFLQSLSQYIAVPLTAAALSSANQQVMEDLDSVAQVPESAEATSQSTSSTGISSSE